MSHMLSGLRYFYGMTNLGFISPCHWIANLKKKFSELGWWYTSEILALRRLRQDDHEFKFSLGYIASLHLNSPKIDK